MHFLFLSDQKPLKDRRWTEVERMSLAAVGVMSLLMAEALGWIH